MDGAGCAAGTILEPRNILDAVELLVAHGAQAIGGVSAIEGVTSAMFTQHIEGQIPNPSGGVEAIITHLISKVFRLPTAHAPLPYRQDVKEKSTRNPRVAAEFISMPHYFSVLKGLAQAPRLVEIEPLNQAPPAAFSVDNVHAIVVPASALGGIPALAAEFTIFRSLQYAKTPRSSTSPTPHWACVTWSKWNPISKRPASCTHCDTVFRSRAFAGRLKFPCQTKRPIHPPWRGWSILRKARELTGRVPLAVPQHRALPAPDGACARNTSDVGPIRLPRVGSAPDQTGRSRRQDRV
jgi:hypothetical protein